MNNHDPRKPDLAGRFVRETDPAASAGQADSSAFDAPAILAAVGEALYFWDIESDALTWSSNAGDTLPVADAETMSTGSGYAQILEADNVRTRFDVVTNSDRRDAGDGVAFEVQYRLRPAAGSQTPLWIEDVGRWFAGPNGRPACVRGAVRIINERHERESRLHQLARCDELTGTLNRRPLLEILEKTLEDSLRFRSSCAFLLLAINDLSRINESYGPEIADQAIGAVVQGIRARLRGKDTLGRYSGSTFGIVLTDCTPDDMAVAAERFIAGVRDEMAATGAGPVAVTVTAGGVSAPRHARTVAEILMRSQEALESAKARRPGSFLAYRPNLEREALRRENVRATEEIAAALNERRIFLAYEPAAAAFDRKPEFYECLMRVRRSDGSALGAGDIVPVAERLGLLRLLDQRVLELVVAELTGAPTLQASLNVSPASTTDPGWWSALGVLLRTHPGVAERLIVEITESTAIHDIDETRGFVTRVKDLGCRIAIDDFGAGYTSFRNLRKLGVDIVKIDGAFVQNITRSDDDRAFVHTLVDLARRLKLATVAEWVQDEATARTLEAWGCDYLQGALIGLAASERPWMREMARAV